jgi:hypothetical protein
MRLTKRSFSACLYAAGQVVAATVTGTLASAGGIPIGGCLTLPPGVRLDEVDYTLVLEDGRWLNLWIASCEAGETIFVTEATLQEAARRILIETSETACPSETYCTGPYGSHGH